MLVAQSQRPYPDNDEEGLIISPLKSFAPGAQTLSTEGNWKVRKYDAWINFVIRRFPQGKPMCH